MSMGKSYEIYNFPVSYIPHIIENYEDTLRGIVIDFALIYALGYDKPTDEDIEQMAKRFRLNLGNKAKTSESARKLIEHYRSSPQPLTFIHQDLLWGYVQNYKGELEVMALALLLALRSVGKNGRPNKTNVQMIAARMSGEIQPNGYVHKDVKRWTTRRKLDSLELYLQERKLAYFPKGHCRGIAFWLTPPTI